MTPRRTAVLMITAAVLLNVAFTGLASAFDYPDVLKQPAGDVLASFRESQGVVSAWFLALALGAAILAPVAVGVGRLSDSRLMRWAVPAGIAAAVVQVVGLLRWPLLVPGWAEAATSGDPAVAADARAAFGTANRVLGNLDRRDRSDTSSPPPGPHWSSPPWAPRSRAAGSSRSVRCRPSSCSSASCHRWTCRDRHRQLRRLHPLEPVADRLRRRDPRAVAPSLHRVRPPATTSTAR